MKSVLAFIALCMILVSPVFAGGNLTVNCTNMAPNFVNTNQTYAMLKMDLNIMPGTGDNSINITSFTITLNGSATYQNVSSVQIQNLTGSALGTNTTWSNLTNNTITIRFSNGLYFSTSTNYTAIVYFTINTTATRFSTVGASLNVTADVNTASSTDNITISGANTSISSQIQDVHATASVSPKFVDTNVINQTFVYTITPKGLDRFGIINITLPTGYTITNVSEVKQGSSVLYNSSVSAAVVSFADKAININYTSTGSPGFGYGEGAAIINFTVNTNSSQVTGANFTSFISGSNMMYMNTTSETTNSTNVTTKQLFNVQSITAIKTAALANGTDYWEFNFTLNFTTNVTTGGLIQFRMTNWNNSAANIMNLTNQTELSNTTLYYANLRMSNDVTKTFNVSNIYNFTQGINIVPTANSLYYVVLHMIIPSGTPISSTWWSTYYTLFRSLP